jgi:hypothetical protein
VQSQVSRNWRVSLLFVAGGTTQQQRRAPGARWFRGRASIAGSDCSVAAFWWVWLDPAGSSVIQRCPTAHERDRLWCVWCLAGCVPTPLMLRRRRTAPTAMRCTQGWSSTTSTTITTSFSNSSTQSMLRSGTLTSGLCRLSLAAMRPVPSRCTTTLPALSASSGASVLQARSFGPAGRQQRRLALPAASTAAQLGLPRGLQRHLSAAAAAAAAAPAAAPVAPGAEQRHADSSASASSSSSNGAAGAGSSAAPSFQEAISRLQEYWAAQGCLVWLPHNTEVGAGTMNPATFLRVLGPEPWNVCYAEPSIRPDDSRWVRASCSAHAQVSVRAQGGGSEGCQGSEPAPTLLETHPTPCVCAVAALTAAGAGTVTTPTASSGIPSSRSS